MRGRFAKSVHLRCRLGGHTLSIRRACAPGKSAHRRHAGRAAGGPIRRLVRTLGLKRTDLRSDLVESGRFHRILQRGREFGDWVDPEAAMQPNCPDPKSGLKFICLNANISRQFEFVQNKRGGAAAAAGPCLCHRARRRILLFAGRQRTAIFNATDAQLCNEMQFQLAS